MKYIDYVKKYDNLDKYIVFLAEMGLSAPEIAVVTETTRSHVYVVLQRNSWLMEAIKNAE
jgi:hypothetical protein